MKKTLIAPCGMNCGICKGFLREKNKCPGCCAGRKINSRRLKCIIGNCSKRLKNNWRFCYKCDTFPCTRLRQLDKRYRKNYNMSMIGNLEYIKKYGISKFVRREEKKWVRGKQVMCVHDKKLY